MVKILITIYNKNITNSSTLLSLLKYANNLNNFEIIIWDNSLRPISDLDLEYLKKRLKINYHHTPENTSLSGIYNYVINNHICIFDHLMILDDDSAFESTLLDKFSKAIDEHKSINLFLPIVLANTKIISPANNYIIKTSYWKQRKKGIIKTKNLTAINSGMLISGRFLKNFVYDDRLKFYGTDNYFMYNYSKVNKLAYIIDESIDHDLSFFSSDLQRKLLNFKETKRSNLIVYSNNIFHLILTIINNFVVSIKYSIMYGSIKFLK